MRDAGCGARAIPPVHRFLSDPRFQAFSHLLGPAAVKEHVTAALAAARAESAGGVPSFEALSAAALTRLSAAGAQLLVPVVNGTGIVLHTNLGRAPLAQPALDAARAIAAGYSNLEYDLARGSRDSRYSRASGFLTQLTGAQDALVVNNCAAAVLLILDTLAKKREVVVCRSQLIEIGGGFRLPDVLERSGAQLVEVGATNKVYLADFEPALTPNTALILRSHTSNYYISGFTHDVAPARTVRAGTPLRRSGR